MSDALLEEILQEVTEDARATVQLAASEYSDKVHEILAYLTKLDLKQKVGAQGKHAKVQINFDVAYPTQVRRHPIPKHREVAGRLEAIRGKIVYLQKTARDVEQQIKRSEELFRDMPEVMGGLGCLGDVQAFAELLLKKHEEAEVLPEIMAVCDERLGIFVMEDGPCGRAYLYTAVIAYFAQKTKVCPRGLAVFALAHEIAHAFLYLGLDATNQQWNTRTLNKPNDELVEALAQYYAAKVLDELYGKIPEAKGAYEEFLKNQTTSKYRAHVPWLSDYHPEIVRGALVPTRQMEKPQTIDMFARALESEKARFPVWVTRTRPAGDMFGYVDSESVPVMDEDIGE